MKTINFLVPALAIMSISFHVSAQQVTSNSYADYKHPQLAAQFKESKKNGSIEVGVASGDNSNVQRTKKRKVRSNEDVALVQNKRKNVSYKHPYGL